MAVVASSAFALAAVTAVVNATSASAHAKLVKITPAVDAQLTTAPKAVVLEFSEPASASFVTVVVTSAAGISVTKGKPTVIGATVTQTLVPRLVAGVYRVAFRVVSKDGHPVTGESGFTLTPAPATSPATLPSTLLSTSPSTTSPATPPSAPATDGAPAPAPAPAPNADQSGGLTPFRTVIAGAVVLMIIGAGLLLWLRERP